MTTSDDDAGRSYDPVVYLTTMPNEPLAQMWAETLRQEGIVVLIKPRGPGFGAWGSTFSFDHEIHVLASQHERAQALIDDLNQAEPEQVATDDR